MTRHLDLLPLPKYQLVRIAIMIERIEFDVNDENVSKCLNFLHDYILKNYDEDRETYHWYMEHSKALWEDFEFIDQTIN